MTKIFITLAVLVFVPILFSTAHSADSLGFFISNSGGDAYMNNNSRGITIVGNGASVVSGRVYIYHTGADAASVQMSLYRLSDSVLIDQTDTVAVLDADGAEWVTLTFVSGVTLKSDTSYLLFTGAVGDISTRNWEDVSTDSGFTRHYFANPGSALGDWPDTLDSYTDVDNFIHPIYVITGDGAVITSETLVRSKLVRGDILIRGHE